AHTNAKSVPAGVAFSLTDQSMASLPIIFIIPIQNGISRIRGGYPPMADDTPKARRILHVKVKTPSADATALLMTMMKNALPLYKAFGEAQVRLLRNADDQTQFLQVIEYETDEAVEFNRQKLASEPIMQNYLQAWRTLFPGAMEIDVYEDIT